MHFLLICSTWTTDVQNILETSEPRPKQNRRPEPRKHIEDPYLSILVFLTRVFLALWNFFLKIFWLNQGALPSIFWNFATEWVLKNPEGSPLLHFLALWHCSKFSGFFENFLMSPKCTPFNFFHILQQTGVSKSPKGPPFHNFENFALFEP